MENELDALDLIRIEPETIPEIESGEERLEITRYEFSEAQQVEDF